jgi:large subunit ribosomal protein L20
MPRVKRGSNRRDRRRKVLGRAKGYFLGKSKLYKFAREAVDRAGTFAYVGRKRKKRDFRRLWIIRINAAARQHDMSYSHDIAVKDPAAFGKLVESAKAARANA